jgi:hypothetical protein
MTSKGASDDGNFERAEMWELNNPATGSAFNVVISFGTGAPIQVSGGGISFIDAHATSGAGFSNSGTTANPSVTVTDATSGDIVVSVLATDNESSSTTPAGTEIWEDESVEGDSTFNCQRQTASGTSTVCSWTNSASGLGWTAAAVAIKEAGGPPPAPLMGQRFYVNG